MDFIKNIIKGIFIGAGAIIPGVSSGVICVIFGIYQKLLDAVLNIFKSFKENISFLLPILIGIFLGVIMFGNFLKYLFYAYPIQTNFTLIGLIVGSIPTMIKEACSKESFKFKHLFYLFVSLIIGISMVILEEKIPNNTSSEYSFLYLVICGICMSIGVIVPGVSSTVILMLMGVYGAYLSSIAGLYFPILIPIGIGLIIGSIICMKIINFLLDRFYIETFYSIIGFSIGSVFVLYQGFSFDINGIISVLCFLLGLFISRNFNK